MKTLFKLSIMITVSFFCVSSFAQSFHYDTVPNPNNNQNRLFRYEFPVREQNNPEQQQSSTPAQEKAIKFDKSRLIFGGALGMSFSKNYSVINIAPQIGYQFNPYFAAGAGVAYNYYGYSNNSYNYLGMNLYSRVTPVRYLALQIQPEIYSMWASYLNGSRTVPCLLLGGGVIMPMGARSGISMMLYYDLVQNEFSPYREQIVYSIGYILNF